MGNRGCSEWISKVLTLLCSRLPPLLYSSSDKEAPHQADLVFCHLDRISTMIDLYTKHLEELAPECPMFFLEAYLWYRGRHYLDTALNVSQYVKKEDQGWVQRLIRGAYICRIIQDFQAEPYRAMDEALYRTHLKELSALRDLPPPGTRFVLTGAAVAYRLYETLDQDVKVRAHQANQASVPLISKATRELVGPAPEYSIGSSSTRAPSSTRLDVISAAVIAYCGAKDYMLSDKNSRAYKLLNTNREGAALGISYNLPELRNYCKTLLQAGDRAHLKAPEIMDIVYYIDSLTSDTTLITEWQYVHTILCNNRGHSAIKRFVNCLADRPEFLPCHLNHSFFDIPAEAEDWLQRRLVACQAVLGPTSKTTYDCSMRLAQHYQETHQEGEAQQVCKRAFAAYKATGKLGIRDGYEPYWADSLYNILNSETAYDTQGVLSLCRDMIHDFTGYDEGSFTEKHAWAQRLQKCLERSTEITSKERQDLARSMLDYLVQVDNNNDRCWMYTRLLRDIDYWGSVSISCVQSDCNLSTEHPRVRLQVEVLGIFQHHRPYGKTSDLTTLANKWATQLANDYLSYDFTLWKEFSNKITSDFQDDLGSSHSICREWREKSYKDLDKREGVSDCDTFIDRALSLPSHDIQAWTEQHIRLCGPDGAEDIDGLDKALTFAGYDQALLQTHGNAKRLDLIALPTIRSPCQYRLPLGRIIGKKSTLVLAL
ncbi:MAG: hypothetical protein Q9211_000953 [Gyalolechia sp. 1 TL-2023]